MEPWGRPYNISNKLLKEEPTLVLERQLWITFSKFWSNP